MHPRGGGVFSRMWDGWLVETPGGDQKLICLPNGVRHLRGCVFGDGI